MNTGISDYLKFTRLRMSISILKIHRKTAPVVSLSYTSRTNVLRYTEILKLEIVATVEYWTCTSANCLLRPRIKICFMYVPWKKQIVAHPHTRDLCGTIVFQSVTISLHKWCQKFASLQISGVTRQTIAYGLLALLNYMKQRCQKKSFKKELVIVHSSVYGHMNVQVTNSTKQFPISYRLPRNHLITHK